MGVGMTRGKPQAPDHPRARMRAWAVGRRGHVGPDGDGGISPILAELYLAHYDALRAFRETIRDLIAMYDVSLSEIVVAHDCHPQYSSTVHAMELPVAKKIPIQHHRALRRRIELRTAPVTATRTMNVLPDPEDLVDGIQRVDFEFVIGVAAADEDFEIVLLPDLRIATRHRAPYVGLLGPEAEVEVLVVP